MEGAVSLQYIHTNAHTKLQAFLFRSKIFNTFMKDSIEEKSTLYIKKTATPRKESTLQTK